MNDKLRLGVIKSLYLANALREYDGDAEQYEGAETKSPIPRTLIWAARTGLVLQLVCVFDEGLQEYLDKHYPSQRCDRLKNRIEFLKSRGLLRRPDRCENINGLRNEIAHEPDRHATWNEWHQTFTTVGRELEHLGVISALEAPVTEPESGSEVADSD